MGKVTIDELFQNDIDNDVEIVELYPGEYQSTNGRWAVTKTAMYKNIDDASIVVGDMEDVPDAVQTKYDELQGY